MISGRKGRGSGGMGGRRAPMDVLCTESESARPGLKACAGMTKDVPRFAPDALAGGFVVDPSQRAQDSNFALHKLALPGDPMNSSLNKMISRRH